MNKKYFFLAGLGLLPALTVARAQMPNASQQVDSVRQHRQLESSLPAGTNAAPEFYDGETGDVGPQSVLQWKPRRTYVEASADEQYFFSDNVFLADHGKQSADVLVSTVQAAYAPTPFDFAGGQLSPRLGYQHQWFNYDLAGSATIHVYPPFRDVGLDAFDFNVSTVFSDVTWRRQNWTFTLGGDYRRLLDSGSYDEFYHEFVPRWSVSREFDLGDSFALAIRYEGDYRFTESPPPQVEITTFPVNSPPVIFPDTFNNRTDQSLALVGNWQLCPHLLLQPFYRLQFTHYTRIDRDDWLNSFGLTLYCPITQQISLRTFVGYDIANTDGFYVQDYQKFDAGAGLNLTVRF